MKRLITNYKCPDCPNGVIVRRDVKKALETEITINLCNVCGKLVGFKASAALELITKSNTLTHD